MYREVITSSDNDRIFKACNTIRVMVWMNTPEKGYANPKKPGEILLTKKEIAIRLGPASKIVSLITKRLWEGLFQYESWLEILSIAQVLNIEKRGCASRLKTIIDFFPEETASVLSPELYEEVSVAPED